MAPRTNSRRETRLLNAAAAIVDGQYPPTIEAVADLIEAVDAYKPRIHEPEKFPAEHGVAGRSYRGGRGD